MIDTYTAYTHEVDNPSAAVADILNQINIANLKKHTVGIVSCFAEYISSGVWEALCKALPFDVVGTTTIENMTSGEIGESMLALMVLTSEDVTFALTLSEPVAEEDELALRALHQQVSENFPEKPALMMSFAPLLTNFGSDFYVEHMTEIFGNVPHFGTLAVDHNPDYRDSRVLLNGEAFPDRISVLFFYGPVEPLFFIGSISDDKVFEEKGIVTSTSGNHLQTVNEMPAIEFLQSMGLSKNKEGGITGINSFPIIVDYNDGSVPVARAMFAVTPEGYAVCGGNIPVGSTLSIGFFDSEEILETTGRTLEKASQWADRKSMLIYSCIGRYFSQGYDPMAEFQKIHAFIEPKGITYMAAYSGGELCPVYGKDGQTVNRNHNNTFVICVF